MKICSRLDLFAPMRPRLVDVLFALFNAALASLVVAGVFFGLPARYWPVDLGAMCVLFALVVATLGLFLPRFQPPARLAVRVILGLGVILFLLLAFSAGHLYGVYGPVGRGGALIFSLVLALILPYLVVFPALELAWLSRD